MIRLTEEQRRAASAEWWAEAEKCGPAGSDDPVVEMQRSAFNWAVYALAEARAEEGYPPELLRLLAALGAGGAAKLLIGPLELLHGMAWATILYAKNCREGMLIVFGVTTRAAATIMRRNILDQISPHFFQVFEYPHGYDLADEFAPYDPDPTSLAAIMRTCANYAIYGLIEAEAEEAMALVEEETCLALAEEETCLALAEEALAQPIVQVLVQLGATVRVREDGALIVSWPPEERA